MSWHWELYTRETHKEDAAAEEGIRMRNLTQVSRFPFVKMKMRRLAPVRMGWQESCSELARFAGF
jgi:hypothetical protein